jgi:hypothetical protein
MIHSNPWSLLHPGLEGVGWNRIVVLVLASGHSPFIIRWFPFDPMHRLDWLEQALGNLEQSWVMFRDA